MNTENSIVAGCTVLLAASVASAGVPVIPPVEINEIRIDQPSSDTDEYFELVGEPGAPLDGLTYVVIGDGAGGCGVIEAAIDLTGSSLDGGGLFVAAEASFTLGVADLTVDLPFENSDTVNHYLVIDYFGAVGDDLDIDDDGILEGMPWGGTLDEVSLLEGIPADCMGDEFPYSPITVGPDGPFVPGHVYKCVPTGEWTIGSFSIADDTPGAPNLPCDLDIMCGDPGTGSCLEPHPTPFCDDLACCELVCSFEPFCCDTAWDPICTEIAIFECDADPCGLPVTGSCFEVTDPFPGCEDPDCCEAVCSVAPFCCDVIWDEMCVDIAIVECLGGDPCGAPDAGGCFSPNPTAGCDIPECCELVCSTMPFCCEVAWDPMCAEDALLSCLPKPPAVLINEIRIDQPGSDTDEYVEIRGMPGTSLDGAFYLTIGDSTASACGAVEGIVDLCGLVIPPDGHLLITEESFTLAGAAPDTFADLAFENSDNVTHMITFGYLGGPDDDIDVDDDGVIDFVPWLDIIDSVALSEGTEVDCDGTDEHVYSDTVVGPDGDFVPGHIYRCVDAPEGAPIGDWAIGEFDIAIGVDSPGEPNPPCEPGKEPCKGDLDGDGIVGPADLAALLGAWGPNPGSPADFDGDGIVGPADLASLLGGWGPCPPPGA